MRIRRMVIWSVFGLYLMFSGCKREKTEERIPVVVEEAGVQNIEIFGGICRSCTSQAVCRGTGLGG